MPMIDRENDQVVQAQLRRVADQASHRLQGGEGRPENADAFLCGMQGRVRLAELLNAEPCFDQVLQFPAVPAPVA
jgi:hypothetical protein